MIDVTPLSNLQIVLIEDDQKGYEITACYIENLNALPEGRRHGIIIRIDKQWHIVGKSVDKTYDDMYEAIINSHTGFATRELALIAAGIL